MDWVYNGRTFTSEMIENNIGFVYLIKNTKNNKSYIGKKLFTASKTKQVKGKKKRFRIESDWKTYYGSNDKLKQDVNDYGPENFERIILRLCETKGECTYFESKYQFENDVLLSDSWYNNWIMCKIRKTHLPEKLLLT